MTWTISRERHGDAAAIRAVHVAAFPTDVEANIVDALRAADHAIISLVARADASIVGHIAFSPVTIEAQDQVLARGLGLAPVAVLPATQRRGIGAALVRAGIDECRRTGVPFVVVLGDPAYYGRFGFARASDLGIANEYGVTDEFMLLVLGENVPGGLVRYCAAFRDG